MSTVIGATGLRTCNCAPCRAPPLAPRHPRGAAFRCSANADSKGSSGSSGSSSKGTSNRGSGKGGTARRRGGGGGAPRSRQQQPASAPRKAAPEQPSYLVPPLRMHVKGELSTADRMPAPLWSTFCGVTNGLWCGITAAYSPFTGQPEPLALDDGRKPLTLLHQCCVEQRVVDEEAGTDSVVRHMARAATPEGLQREMVQGGQLQFPACSTTAAAGGRLAECWDEERFSSEQEGLVVFDGGSYSLGPSVIGSPEEVQAPAQVEFDDMAALAATAALEAAMAAESAVDSLELIAEEGEEGAEEDEGGSGRQVDVEAITAQEQAEFDWTAVVIEHCMQWGGEQRLRIRLTLDTAGGGDGTDLEIQPLRVAVSREAWEGLPGSYNPSSQSDGEAEQQEASRRVLLDSQALTGSWKVFEVSAVTVDDVSMSTGLPAPSTLYTAAETLRSFDVRVPEDGGDGALLRLPHSCGVQLETLRLDNQRRRGLRVSTCWCPQPDMLLVMARLYDADGRLLEVSTSTAIPAQQQ